jgi:UDP-N-acetylglucosamine--N-acetylmuramyl-(pentapeptide) pyrophosphoryl-undecaprenol N-acetylglucosamine transferase
VHVAASALAVRRQLRARGVSLVVAFGGFGCLDAALAAWALGIPVFVHEANARGGLSTRLVAHLADRVFLGVEAAAPDFPFGRTTATGTPVRAAFFDVPERRRARRREHPGPSRVLVMGGSLGSAFLDRRFPATAARLASLGTRLHVTHLGGGGDMGAIEGAYRAANVPAAVQPPLRDMASALTDCDFVVSRAGASSLAEIAASGTPALFVPLPKHAREHQRANLLAAQRWAPVWWLPEEGWNDGEVAEALASRLGDARSLAEAGEAMRILAAPDCACRIVEACLARLTRGTA